MKRILSITTFILCAISSTIVSKTSSWPTQSEQRKMLHAEIVKCLKLPASTTPKELCDLTYDQQVAYFCLMLDLIMDPKCKITQPILSEAFKKYCTEIKKRHLKLYDHFGKTTKGFWNTVNYMKKYNGMPSSDIPQAASAKRIVDRKAFDKKYSSYYSQYKVMKKVSKKFR